MTDLAVNQLQTQMQFAPVTNLQVLRDKIPSRKIRAEIADLVYLDPPFNSARNYNLLFKQVKRELAAEPEHWDWSSARAYARPESHANIDMFESLSVVKRGRF